MRNNARRENFNFDQPSSRRISLVVKCVTIVLVLAVLLQIQIVTQNYTNYLYQNDEKQLRLAEQALMAEFYNNVEIVKSLETYQEIHPFSLQEFPVKGSKLVQELNAHFTNNNIVDDIFMHFFCDEYFYSTKTSYSTRSFMTRFNLPYGGGQLGDRFLEQMHKAQQPFFIRDVTPRQSASQTMKNKYILYVYPYRIAGITQGVVIFQINEANLNSWIGNDMEKDIYIFDSNYNLLNYSEISRDILDALTSDRIEELMKKTITGETTQALSHDHYYILNGAISNTDLYYIRFAEHTELHYPLHWLNYLYLLLIVLLLGLSVIVHKEILQYKKTVAIRNRQTFLQQLVGKKIHDETEMRESGKKYGVTLYATWHFVVIGQKELQEKESVRKKFFDESCFPYLFRVPMADDLNVWIIGASQYMAGIDLQELYATAQLTVGSMYAEISGIHCSYIEARSFWDIAFEPQTYYRELQKSLDICYEPLIYQANEALENNDPDKFVLMVKAIRQKCKEQSSPSVLQCHIWRKLIHLTQRKLKPLSEDRVFNENLIQPEWNEDPKILLELLEQEIDTLYLAKKQMDRPKAPPLTIEDMLDVIERNYCDENFSLQILADHFDLSLSYLSLFFKEKQGDNLLNYYTTLRMKKAKELLNTTQLSLKQIATEVGYSNVSSFIRRFRQLYGRTPGTYKKNPPSTSM